jgi:hypothetical protein
MFHYRWYLPKALPSIVEQTVADTSCISQDGRCIQPWTMENLKTRFQDFSEGDFSLVFYPIAESIYIRGGGLAYCEKYGLTMGDGSFPVSKQNM